MGGRGPEPSLLDLCLAVGRRSVRLGGSRGFHDRVSRSLTQDDDVYNMLDYARKSGVLQKKRYYHSRQVTRASISERSAGKRHKDRTLSSSYSKTVEMAPSTPKSSRSGAASRHSSYCDVLGPDVCEECLKRHKQRRFVRNAAMKVTTSLPSLHSESPGARGKSRKAKSLKGSQDLAPLRLTDKPWSEKNVAFSDNPISVVKRAQRQAPLCSNPKKAASTGRLTPSVGHTNSRKAASTGRLTPQVPPICFSSSQPKLSHSQLHKRVIDNSRNAKSLSGSIVTEAFAQHPTRRS